MVLSLTAKVERDDSCKVSLTSRVGKQQRYLTSGNGEIVATLECVLSVSLHTIFLIMSDFKTGYIVIGGATCAWMPPQSKSEQAYTVTVLSKKAVTDFPFVPAADE